MSMTGRNALLTLGLTAALALAACGGDDPTAPVIPPPGDPAGPNDPILREQLLHALPPYEEMRAKLQEIVAEQNGGLGFHMWAAIVDRDGFAFAYPFEEVRFACVEEWDSGVDDAFRASVRIAP